MITEKNQCVTNFKNGRKATFIYIQTFNSTVLLSTESWKTWDLKGLARMRFGCFKIHTCQGQQKDI